ncbi:MAG: phosphate ABC transporter permease PstA [Candidatus Pristimantibacillus lignocellulolyticus]|uniref:Phosphate transport system permease protein PstA n=1 Tax=Candidatus Pristimantibacillus lignocellulolyticus TaxID=2994561 RepID=A0A9J6ZF35_9BACL|nr:MAG: phosphate ABC transporter permease PstA [Candidatus Pristimantibacillus lignocellulolyticus]
MNIFQDANRKQIANRRLKDQLLHTIFLLATSVGIIALTVLIIDIIIDGWAHLSPDLFTNFPSRKAENAGMKSGLMGSLYILLILIPLSFVMGVGAAIYLEEYAPKNKFTRLVQLNISTLAGVPSIVYGILGLALFVRMLGLEKSLISGALTMTLLVLPVIIVASQEAIRAVPRSRRDASFALGATKWQTVSRSVLPSSIPGILTGVILAVSRAIGETAPLIIVGASTYVAFLPQSLTDAFTAMPIQIYNWISRPQVEFKDLGASAIIILLAILILLNISAVIIRNRYQKKF